MSLPRLSVRRPVATVMFYLAIILLGLISLQQLAVDLLPDLNYPRLLVRTRLPEAAPEEVVEFITRPVEEALGAVSGMKRITSRSREGVSLVTLYSELVELWSSTGAAIWITPHSPCGRSQVKFAGSNLFFS